MVVCSPCHYSVSARRPPYLPLLFKPILLNIFHRPPFSIRRAAPQTINAIGDHSSSFSGTPQQQHQQKQKQVRTLFPGGFKRPELNIPTLVLRLSVDEVLEREADVDVALLKRVGVVVLDGGDQSGAMLYEAACALKSLLRDRAYLLIAERVDIAAAVGASGVVLSDSARTVQDTASAITASSSEGADFLIMSTKTVKSVAGQESSITQFVKVPVFFTTSDSHGNQLPSKMASKLLQYGAGGMVMSLNDLISFDDGILKMFSMAYMANDILQDAFPNSGTKTDDSRVVNNGQKGISGFTRLDDREIQLIERERQLIDEAVSIIQKATPMMKDVSLLVDAAARLYEPFLLVIVGEFNSGKSTVINALLGKRYLEEGVVPTTNEITLLLYSDMDSDNHKRCERNPDGQFICYLSSPILKDMNLVDTPGTNVILQRQQRLTEEFVPRADLILFVISADRPLTESEVTLFFVFGLLYTTCMVL
ncbi:Dynamin family [Musa troglodytarum]|uniref:Dynamin family n=1 Tax=Musa troglodytarum TaxID=320322 RepID=A0A9E7FYD2_9LILI|nr:Dynamin family [Musa troglodytarum]